MKNRKIMKLLYIILAVVALSSAYGLTIDELIESYNYNFTDGTLNITAKVDSMDDLDSDGINDTLFINLTTSLSSGSFFAFIDLDDPNGLITVGGNQTITDNKFRFNISSELLSQSKYNYTIRIENENHTTIFEEHGIETSEYPSFEQGITILSFSDGNVGTESIQLNLTLNVTSNETANVTVVLGFNDSQISETEQKTLVAGTQVISLNFDNETIKSTHFNGDFTVTSVRIGDKLFDTNTSTAIYDFEDFAKTSYIKNFTDSAVDTNNNNLSEFLEINFTINVKTANNYTLEADIYDLFTNFVASINETRTLSTGFQVITAQVNGTDIYKSGFGGPYLVSFAKLSVGNTTKDIIFDAHTTHVTFFTDYERPPQPDLNISIGTTLLTASNKTNISINITNTGEAPAFNIFVDVFDNASYDEQSSVAFLDVDESQAFNFTISDTAELPIVTAVVDFKNTIDESNESNNIVDTNFDAIEVISLTEIHADGGFRVFEAIINNTGTLTLSDVEWSFDSGDGTVINSTNNLTLIAGESARLFIAHNYTSDGSFTAKANTSSGSVSAEKTLGIGIGNSTDITVSGLEVLYSKERRFVFGFNMTNNANFTSALNWSLDTGDQTIIGTNVITLATNETAFVVVDYNYSITGELTVTATGTNGTSQNQVSIQVDVPDIEVFDLDLLNVSSTLAIFEFGINNTLATNLTGVNWTFDTKDSSVILGEILANLTQSEFMYVIVQHNFSASGSYNVNATAINGSLFDWRNKTFNI